MLSLIRPMEIGQTTVFRDHVNDNQFWYLPNHVAINRDGSGPKVQLMLWHPAEVAAAIAEGREVWNGEGHKDAEKLVEAGVVATTNINGAGNFNARHAEQLRGARVVHVCDRDLAGWRRALKCARLLDEVAASVRFVLPFPEQAKADAYDHVAQGHTV